MMIFLSIIFTAFAETTSIVITPETPAVNVETPNYVQVVVDEIKFCAIRFEKVDTTCRLSEGEVLPKTVLTEQQWFFNDYGVAEKGDFTLNYVLTEANSDIDQPGSLILTSASPAERCIDHLPYDSTVKWSEEHPYEGGDFDAWKQLKDGDQLFVCTQLTTKQEFDYNNDPTVVLSDPAMACSNNGSYVRCKCDNPDHIDNIWLFQIKNFRKFKPLRVCKRTTERCTMPGQDQSSPEGPWWYIGGAEFSITCTLGSDDENIEILSYKGLTTAGEPGSRRWYKRLFVTEQLVKPFNSDPKRLSPGSDYKRLTEAFFPFGNAAWADSIISGGFPYVSGRANFQWGIFGCTLCTPLLPVGAKCKVCETEPPVSYAPLEYPDDCQEIQIDSVGWTPRFASDECGKYTVAGEDYYSPLYPLLFPAPVDYLSERLLKLGSKSLGIEQIEEGSWQETVQAGTDKRELMTFRRRLSPFGWAGLPGDSLFGAAKNEAYEAAWNDYSKRGDLILSVLKTDPDLVPWIATLLEGDFTGKPTVEKILRNFPWNGVDGNGESTGMGTTLTGYVQVAKCPFIIVPFTKATILDAETPEEAEAAALMAESVKEIRISRTKELWHEVVFTNIPETHCVNLIKCDERCLGSEPDYNDLFKCPTAEEDYDGQNTLEQVQNKNCRLEDVKFNLECYPIRKDYERRIVLPHVDEFDAVNPIPADFCKSKDASYIRQFNNFPTEGKVTCDKWVPGAENYLPGYFNDPFNRTITIEQQGGACQGGIPWGARCRVCEIKAPVGFGISENIELNGGCKYLPPFWKPSTQCDCPQGEDEEEATTEAPAQGTLSPGFVELEAQLKPYNPGPVFEHVFV